MTKFSPPAINPSTFIGDNMSLERGLIHVYTGNGKGKTTAALGLALRAVGAGLKVIVIQFMKGRRYSELEAISGIENLTIEQYGRDEFVSKEKPAGVDMELAHKGLDRAREVIGLGEKDVVILDEINVALDFKLVLIDEVLRLIAEKPSHVELVLTGRYAPPELVRMADFVTEMLDIRHPFEKGVQARKGIDW